MRRDFPLAGRTILVVEDDFFQAQDLARELFDQGAALLGPFGTLGDAEAALKAGAGADAAVLDIRVRDRLVYPFARRLERRGIPYLFATGYDRTSVPDRFRTITVCEKPYPASSLIGAVRTLCGC